MRCTHTAAVAARRIRRSLESIAPSDEGLAGGREARWRNSEDYVQDAAAMQIQARYRGGKARGEARRARAVLPG